MDISFRQEKLKQQVSDEKKLKKEFGRLARYVQARLALLREAKTLADIPHTPPPRRHQLTQKRDEVFAVDVKTKADKWRIEFEVANSPVPRKTDGGIDLEAVTAIEIIAISNHYK